MHRITYIGYKYTYLPLVVTFLMKSLSKVTDKSPLNHPGMEDDYRGYRRFPHISFKAV